MFIQVNHFLKIALFLLFISLQNQGFSQQGDSYIERAETLVDNGNIYQAQRLLNKAKKEDYGWCGNASTEAFRKIRFQEARINIELGKKEKALNLLNKCACWAGPCDKVDSLKVQLLVDKYGKEDVKKAIDEEFARYENEEIPEGIDMTDPYLIALAEDSVGLKINHNLTLKGRKANHQVYLASTQEDKYKWFRVIVEEQPFYALLK